LKNAARMVLNGMENPLDLHFLLLAQQVDFIEGKSGHGHYMPGGENISGICREIPESLLPFSRLLYGAAADD